MDELMMCFGCEFQLKQIQTIDNNCKPLQLFQEEEKNRRERIIYFST